MAAFEPGPVNVYGMPISANVIPAVLVCLDHKCGQMEMMNMMEGAHKTPEALAINPFHQIPSMKDSSNDFCLAEGNAILRYIACKYAPLTYAGALGGDAQILARAEIDWALDWCSTNWGKNFSQLWYPVVGFGAPPDDYPKACEAALANLAKFEAKFLSGGNKFIGGDTLTIADYKCAINFWYVGFPAVKKVTGFELPPRIQTYCDDFISACPSTEFLETAKGFMASKE